MGKKVVTLDEMIELAIGTPESSVNFLILQKVLKILARYYCKEDFKFELDMDDLKADVNTIGGDSKSSNSFSGSFESGVKVKEEAESYHGRSTGDETKIKIEKDSETKIKIEKDSETKIKIEKDSETKIKIEKHSEDEIEDSQGGEKKEKKKYDIDSEKRESHPNKKKDESKKKSSEKSKKRSSERHRKKSSDNIRKNEAEGGSQMDFDSTKSIIQELQDLTSKSENRTNDLENKFKELTDRVDAINQTISLHLDENHLAEINGEIEKLKKEIDNTSDQCNGVTNNINDQSSQILDMLATINDIQLRKVENEELIDLLSGKADHSFVNEKISTNQFNDTVQELKDIINEHSMQLDVAKLETNTNFDEIKKELGTKLFAEEFDDTKTKIYKEIIKLTEQQTLILAQQNEHVAAGAKMRNLNCFVCNNDVVMLLEQETIPKFRGLKTSLQALEPLVGSKINVGKNTPEWKKHQLKTKGFTRNSKASRHNSNHLREKSTYVQGRNGYIYRGNTGCDCVEGINASNRVRRTKCCCDIPACCDTVEAKNMKNISNTGKVKSTSNIIQKNGITENTGVGDIPKRSAVKAKKENNLLEELNDAKQTTGINVKVEPTNGIKIVESKVADIPNSSLEIENDTEPAKIVDQDSISNVPAEAIAVSENIHQIKKTENEIENPLDGNLAVKIENDTDPRLNEDQAVSDHPDEMSAVSDNTNAVSKS